MKTIKILGLCFLAFLFSKQLKAQSFNFKNYTVEDGLPYVQIYDVFQDDKGYLWTGGYGGLSSFDGIKFTNYGPRKGLVNYWVKSISQDSSKNLIIGTLNGLSIFNGKNFTNYTTQNGLPNNYINSIASKGAETAIATQGGLCYLLHEKIRIDERFKGVNVTRVKSAYNKDYVVATTKKIAVVSANKVQPVCAFMPESDTVITFFEIDKNSTLWVGTNKGLFYINNYDLQNSIKKTIATPIKDVISCLFADYKNVLWIGTDNALVKYFNNTVTRYQISKEESANDVGCITADYEQNIWIGTHSGLFKFRDEGYIYYGLEDGLKNGFMQSIVKDKKNRMWFSSGGGVTTFENSKFVNYTSQNGLPSNAASALAVDSFNRLWIGTNKGLCYMLNSRITHAVFLQQNFIHVLYIDKKNNLWVGLKNQVACIANINSYPKTTVKYYTLPLSQQTEGFQLSSMCEDAEGNLYIASFLGGLFVFDGKTIKDVTTTFGIQTRAVLDVKFATNNFLYVATLDGVYAVNLESRTSEKFTEDDGLSSNLVYSLLLTDKEQTLWAGTNQGANKIDLQSFFQSHVKNILSFGKTEGFKGLECNTGGLCLDSAGSIWFSTVNGLVKHNPVKFINNDNEARLSFTKLKLFYDDTLLPQKAKLASSLNNIRFDFIGICLTNPEKVLYIHKLEGFEKSWSPTTSQNNVTYSNLPPGDYVFKVRCCNNQGVWSTEPLTFAFSVDSPYWQHWWFILSLLGFIALAVYVVFQIRLNQLKKEQEKESRTQVEIAKNELKALRAQMNPHFLFNSLNSIQHFILNSKSEEAVFYLNRFAKLMRMILNNSEKPTVTLNEEINALKIYIDLEKMRFSNLFDYEIEVDDEIDADYEQIPSMLLQPYVENAILHGLMPKDAPGFLKIHFYTKDHFIYATIEDNGIGRKKAAEIKNQSRKNHASLGMKITTDRLRILSHIQQLDYTVNFIDLYDATGSSTGTLVEIKWPMG